MAAIFRNYLSRYLGQILGWGLSLALIGGYLVTFYDTFAKQSSIFVEAIKGYPPELLAFFGNMDKIYTPGGFLDTEFFSYMPIILGVFALLAGGSLLVGDEEKGILDLVLAYPVSRLSLFVGRLAGFLVSLLGILFITWVGFVIMLSKSTMKVSPAELTLPLISLFVLMVFFGTFALLLSMLLPSARLAATVSGLVLVAGFFISSLARVDDKLKEIARFSPLNYYQGGMAVAGLDWKWFGGLLGFALLFILLAWLRFARRDIRVGGEGGWKMPLLTTAKTAN
ncbi:MAG TPA: ABC transporter permease subunit [Anaerolineales bacterium]